MFVPSGHFLFGDRLNPNEQHLVWTQGFFIGQFEVTNAEFRVFLSSPDGFANDLNWTEEGKRWKARSLDSSSARLIPGDAEFIRFGKSDQPVTQVTWFEAIAYCNWLTKRFGHGRWLYSLPTEAEWEKAARGPDNFDYPLGQSLSDAEIGSYNWKKNPLTEVTVFGTGDSEGKFRPNRYGIFHLGGNVVEWTLGTNRAFNREKPYADDDRNREDLTGVRVVRGGSWYSASNALLYIPYRDTFQPEISHNDLGFRVVVRNLMQ
jgi:formylglycine-generating enzyme required for sulfatase activity